MKKIVLGSMHCHLAKLRNTLRWEVGNFKLNFLVKKLNAELFSRTSFYG